MAFRTVALSTGVKTISFLDYSLEVNLKVLFHPSCLARAVFWFALVAAIFMGHENGDNKGKPRDDTCKACWMKETL